MRSSFTGGACVRCPRSATRPRRRTLVLQQVVEPRRPLHVGQRARRSVLQPHVFKGNPWEYSRIEAGTVLPDGLAIEEFLVSLSRVAMEIKRPHGRRQVGDRQRVPHEQIWTQVAE
jgi:hypothetical protein